MRRRRRRLAVRSVAGVAAALTVAVVAAGVPGARDTGTEVPAAPAAYVVQRAGNALHAAGSAAIAQATVTTTITGNAQISGSTTTAEEWFYGGRWRSVTNSPAGHPVYDQGSSASSVYTLVSYPTRTWARQHVPHPGAPASSPEARVPSPVASAPSPEGCRPAAAALLLYKLGLLPGAIVSSASRKPGIVVTALRTAISCGALTVAGRERIDGIQVIKLRNRRNSPASETIWVSPDTYLPVRAVIRADLLTRHGMLPVRQTTDLTWLPPTAQNLAKLTVPIPAGYRRVPLTQAIRRIRLQGTGPPLLPVPAHCCPAPAGPACKVIHFSGSGAR